MLPSSSGPVVIRKGKRGLETDRGNWMLLGQHPVVFGHESSCWRVVVSAAEHWLKPPCLGKPKQSAHVCVCIPSLGQEDVCIAEIASDAGNRLSFSVFSGCSY